MDKIEKAEESHLSVFYKLRQAFGGRVGIGGISVFYIRNAQCYLRRTVAPNRGLPGWLYHIRVATCRLSGNFKCFVRRRIRQLSPPIPPDLPEWARVIIQVAWGDHPKRTA